MSDNTQADNTQYDQRVIEVIAEVFKRSTNFTPTISTVMEVLAAKKVMGVTEDGIPLVRELDQFIAAHIGPGSQDQMVITMVMSAADVTSGVLPLWMRSYFLEEVPESVRSAFCVKLTELFENDGGFNTYYTVLRAAAISPA